MAKFLNGTGIEDATIFALPEITESDWLPAGGPDLTAPQKNSLYMDHVKVRTKLTMDFPDKFASMFASLQAETSPELWAKIESHSKFEVAQQNSCPFRLWNVILRVTLTQRDAHDPSTRILAKMALEKSFTKTFQKSGESVSEFKLRFQDLISLLVAAGAEGDDAGYRQPQQPELALMFLERLDRARYLKLQVTIRNGIERGVTPPATLSRRYVSNRIQAKRSRRR